jgi:hypothetical protein
MIRIYFVGDGPRDAATVPALIASILSEQVDLVPGEHHWLRLHKDAGDGYERKVRYATTEARKAKAMALVAVVDRDKAKAGHRMKALRSAREADRKQNPPLPTAFGEANPHGEAWLLDDPRAVREALGLGHDVEIVSPKKTKNPKGSLESLIETTRSRAQIMTALAEIAAVVDPSRCQNAEHTGFREFMDEVRDEIGPIVTP